MIRHAFLYVLLGPLTFGCTRPGEPSNPVAEEQPVAAKDVKPPAPARRFTGTLHGGVIAIGAETTGWVLESADLGRIDVDVSKAADAAGELDGKAVVIEGELVTVNWPERGEKQMLMAQRIRAADDDNKHRDHGDGGADE